MTIHGRKTYLTSILLAVFAVWVAPILATGATIDNPQAGIERVIMGVGILLALNNASLRHAISHLERKIESLENGDDET